VSGYVEGMYVDVAPIDTAVVVELPVTEGERIVAGQVLAELEKTDSQLALTEARALANAAKATLSDMYKGLRPEEKRALQASVSSWEAEVSRLQDEYDRSAVLFGKSVVSLAEHRRSKTALAVAKARLDEARAGLTAAGLPSRDGVVESQQAKYEAADAALRLAEWRNSKRTIRAEVNGRIEQIMRRPGERAGPWDPILTILPDGNTRVKFYVAGSDMSWFRLGEIVDLSCASCPAKLTARISHVANSPAFTPPVLYSAEQNQRLTYAVEARPEEGETALQPGLIVTIRPHPQK
jgi:HlyD family secretion protein